jgi:hypothetical protein
MTRLVSWLDALLWWLDERRAIREHHLTPTKEAPAQCVAARRVTGGENSDADKA